MEPPQTLLLTETGLESRPDGSVAVNVGPIIRALKFLTEGRGDDRGVDEAGQPLPDLMSLAFEVVESIIVGGRKADYFRRVKRELDAESGGVGRSSLALAKRASRLQPLAEDEGPDVAALEQATSALQSLLVGLEGAAAQLLGAMTALGVAPKPKRKPKQKVASKKAKQAKTKPTPSAPKAKRATPRSGRAKAPARRKHKSR